MFNVNSLREIMMRFFIVFCLVFSSVDLLFADELPSASAERCEPVEGFDGCETIDGEEEFPEEEN